TRWTRRSGRTSGWGGKAARAPCVHAIFLCLGLIPAQTRADIPWPEVVQRLAYENEKLVRRPQGHAGDYFVVCTLYYTPMESGFTFERGLDATPVTIPGLHGRTYRRRFLRSVQQDEVVRLGPP